MSYSLMNATQTTLSMLEAPINGKHSALAVCSRKPIRDSVVLTMNESQQLAIQGLATCGSWLCPHCREIKLKRMAESLKKVRTRCANDNLTTQMITLTVPSQRNVELDLLLQVLSLAWKTVFGSNSTGRRNKSNLGLVDFRYVRCLEVNSTVFTDEYNRDITSAGLTLKDYDYNRAELLHDLQPVYNRYVSYHAHYHLILIGHELTEQQQEYLQLEWSKAVYLLCLKYHISANFFDVLQHSVYVSEPVQGFSNSYFTWDELTGKKHARQANSYNFNDIVRKQNSLLFQLIYFEYTQALRGKSKFTVSHNLWSWAEQEQEQQEEQEQPKPKSEPIAELPIDTWHLILNANQADNLLQCKTFEQVYWFVFDFLSRISRFSFFAMPISLAERHL